MSRNLVKDDHRDSGLLKCTVTLVISAKWKQNNPVYMLGDQILHNTLLDLGVTDKGTGDHRIIILHKKL